MTKKDASVWLDVLAGSHDRLSDLVSELDDETLRRRSYCEGWTIAQVLSHIGSGAEIIGKAVDAVVAGEPPPSRDTYPQIWDRWNAMAPREVRDAALATDGGFVEMLERLGDALDEMAFTLFGGMRFDAVGLIGIRLSEHALHTWDVAVALDPGALVDPDAVALLVDRLPQVAGRLAKLEDADLSHPIHVRIVTSEPHRVFRLEADETVNLAPEDDEGAARPVLHLPAEAFLRLTYGRLDPAHSPPVAAEERATLDDVRRIFPGF